MTVATATKSRPIIMSAESVRAMLKKHKTQTRRVVKPQPPSHVTHVVTICRTANHPAGPPLEFQWMEGPEDFDDPQCQCVGDFFSCPYGVPGDVLWVRETWAVAPKWDDTKPRDLPDDIAVFYAADDSWLLYGAMPRHGLQGRTRSARFMPHRFARLEPPVTNVRVQRVQETSEADCLAEGLTIEACERVFESCAGKHEAREYQWLESEGDREIDDRTLCPPCAKRECASRSGWEIHVDYCPEVDGPAYCDECGHAVFVSLTDYGIDREIFLESDCQVDTPRFAATSPRDARIMQMIAGCGHLNDRQTQRLSKIGLATLWDSLNAKRGHPWSNNDWVWAVTFEPADTVDSQEKRGRA